MQRAAEAAGVSDRTVAKWVARYRAGEPMATAPRRPGGCPRGLPSRRSRRSRRLRRLRMTAAEIAEVLGMAISTVSRWLEADRPRQAIAPRAARAAQPLRALAPRRARSTSTSRSSAGSTGRRPPDDRPAGQASASVGRQSRRAERRLGVRPRLRRRRHPPRLRRGAARREGRRPRRASCAGRRPGSPRWGSPSRR